MRTYTLRVNFNHIRREIDNHYFMYKDIFYKCFIASLYKNYLNNNSILRNILIDNSQYWQYLINAINRTQPMVAVLEELSIDKYSDIFLELDIYLDQFIMPKYSPTMINVYSLDISDNFYLEVKNKQVRGVNASKNILH